jgi:type VI protein secretion system component Hcp
VSVLISYTIEGHGHGAYVTVALTNGMLSDFHHEGHADGTAIERVMFTYSKIEFTWTDGGITSTDDWMTDTST